MHIVIERAEVDVSEAPLLSQYVELAERATHAQKGGREARAQWSNTKGVRVVNESAIRKLGRYVRERRKELGINSATHLDVKMMELLPGERWYIGKTQYLETRQTEFPDADELQALAHALEVSTEHLLFVSGYLTAAS